MPASSPGGPGQGVPAAGALPSAILAAYPPRSRFLATPANDRLCARCPFVENTASNIGGRALLFGQNQRVVGSDRLPDAWLRHVGTPSPRRAAPERCSTITIAPSKSILWILVCGYSFKAIRRTKGIGLQAFL